MKTTGEILPGLMRILRKALAESTDPNAWTAWVHVDQITEELGIDREDMKFLVRRPRVKATLRQTGIGVIKLLGNFIYVWTPPSMRDPRRA